MHHVASLKSSCPPLLKFSSFPSCRVDILTAFIYKPMQQQVPALSGCCCPQLGSAADRENDASDSIINSLHVRICHVTQAGHLFSSSSGLNARYRVRVNTVRGYVTRRRTVFLSKHCIFAVASRRPQRRLSHGDRRKASTTIIIIPCDSLSVKQTSCFWQ